MAFLGSLGSALGLPSTGTVVTALTGNPQLGASARIGANIISPLGGNLEEFITKPNTEAPPTDRPTLQNTPNYQAQTQPGDGISLASYNAGTQIPGLGKPNIRPANAPALTGGAIIGGAMLLADIFMDAFGQQKKLIITRRLKAKTRKLFNDLGGNIPAVAEALSMTTGNSYSVENVMKILTHKLRNDGQMITKAQIRNGRKLVHRLKAMEMVRKELGASRRPTTRKRASFTRAGSITTKI